MKYYRLYPIDGVQSTHLEGIGDSYTLCGQDTAGDDYIYIKPPELLKGEKHRITCKDCLQIIDLVKEHLKKT